jgi:pimeloyl-ACP methyl ester carboxylesterase
MLVSHHPAAFAGLILLASYASNDSDLSSLSLPVLSISASNDGLATPAKLAAAEHLLPAGTQHVLLEGGNHGQFGSYGEQKGDGEPGISRETQQAQVAAAVLSFLERLP